MQWLRAGWGGGHGHALGHGDGHALGQGHALGHALGHSLDHGFGPGILSDKDRKGGLAQCSGWEVGGEVVLVMLLVYSPHHTSLLEVSRSSIFTLIYII